MKRISKVLLLALMVCTLFAGCSIETIQSKKEDSKYNFYYLNTNETALKSEPYEPKEETKEYIRLHMEILRESMKKEGLLFAIAVDKKDFDNSSICIIEKEALISKGKAEGIKFRLDELNKGLL